MWLRAAAGEHARRPAGGLPQAAPARPRYGAVDRGRAAASAAAAQQRHVEPALLLVTDQEGAATCRTTTARGTRAPPLRCAARSGRRVRRLAARVRWHLHLSGHWERVCGDLRLAGPKGVLVGIRVRCACDSAW